MKKIISLMMSTFILVFSNAIICCAKDNEMYMPQAYDIYTVEKEAVLPFTQSMVSINPPECAVGIPGNIETVSFNINMTGYLHYDYFTSRYVSASSPKIEVQYTGPVVLQLNSVSTYYIDNGNSVTFYFKGNLTGRVDNGLVISIDYGKISGNFTVEK